MKKNVSFMIFLLIACGCFDSKRSDSVSSIMSNDREITILFLNKLKTDTLTIPLSSLVEGCELVLLENIEEALFKPWKTTITEKYIGVMQENGSYKLFRRSGKFLCNVGSVGQGPGEYFIICDDIIDEENELIYLAPFIGSKIFVYNTSGRFLKNIEMPQSMVSPRMFLSDNILTVVYIAPATMNSMVTQINIHTEQVLNEFTTQIPQQGQDITYNSRNIKSIYDIVHAAFDTIYHIDISNNSVRPIFIMSYNSSEELVKLHNQLNKDLILSSIRRKGFGITEFVVTDMKNKKSSWVKVKNDYFGNFDAPIFIDKFNFNNGFYVNNIQPEQLMENIEQRLTESNCTEKDKQILQKTLSTLKENNNNVVFIGKIKNEIELNNKMSKNK